jgi:hypothetical protein
MSKYKDKKEMIESFQRKKLSFSIIWPINLGNHYLQGYFQEYLGFDGKEVPRNN